jgi:hypothetical protein
VRVEQGLDLLSDCFVHATSSAGVTRRILRLRVSNMLTCVKSVRGNIAIAGQLAFGPWR